MIDIMLPVLMFLISVLLIGCIVTISLIIRSILIDIENEEESWNA